MRNKTTSRRKFQFDEWNARHEDFGTVGSRCRHDAESEQSLHVKLHNSECGSYGVGEDDN